MSNENDILRLTAMIEALDAKVEARLRDTTPMWEVVVSRLDTIIAEQASQGRRLEAVEARLEAVEARLEAVETEARQLRRRIEGMTGELSRDLLEVRATHRDLEVRIEKLEKPPA
ncbi:MAG TPA: hypothetical protein VFF31_14440 [Blastocatellia bacterium]|nr:hypothetical protein [Blastocatellia bacterium]